MGRTVSSSRAAQPGGTRAVAGWGGLRQNRLDDLEERHLMLTRRLTITGVLGLVAEHAGAAEPVRWRIATEYPATAIPGEGVAAFADAVTAGSAGALTVEPAFDAPEGLRSATMAAAVVDRRLQAGDAFAAAMGPLFGLSGLPFLTASVADAGRLLEVARPAYQAALAATGLRLLYASPWPPSGLWSRAPVLDAGALDGLRVRTYDAASTAVFAAAGARPTLLSFADALPRLRAGELDAAVSSGDGGAGLRLWEVLPHFTVLDYAYPLSLAFCAERALEALTPDPARVVLAAGEATERRQFDAMAGRVARNQARMQENGVTITASPSLRDHLTAGAGPVIDSWAQKAGPAGRAALARFQRG